MSGPVLRFGGSVDEQALLSAVLDALDALVIVMDPSGAIRGFNRMCEQTSGYRFSEVEGRLVWDVLLAPEERAEVRQVFSRLRAGDFPNRHVNDWVTRDGARRQIEWSNSVVLDADGAVALVVGTGLDVTTLRQAEQGLELSERRYRVLMEALHEGIWVIDAQGRTTLANDRMAQMLGYSADEMLGRELFDFTDAEGRTRSERNLQRRREGVREQHEFEFIRKDGSRLHALLAAGPLTDERGQFAGAIAGVMDITESKRTREALRRRNEELDAYAHTVAHDLKAPMNSVVVALDLLRERWDELETRQRTRLMGVASNAARRTADIVDQLLLLAQVRSGVAEPTALDMDEIVDHALDEARASFPGLELTPERPSSWLPAMGHGPWVERIWVNYLSNALRYAGKLPRLRLGAEPDGAGLVVFWLQDDGPGVPPDQRAHLFEPRTGPKAPGAAGHGLGLSIVRRIARRLGGDAGYQDAEGGGAVFWFSLPAVGQTAPRSPSDGAE